MKNFFDQYVIVAYLVVWLLIAAICVYCNWLISHTKNTKNRRIVRIRYSIAQLMEI